MTGQKKREDVITVQILEAKPNKLFTEEQRAWVRFLRYSHAVRCAECGKRRRLHWTMLFSFEAKSMGFVIPVPGKGAHLPLTPVCASHLLVPAAMGAPPARRKGHPPRMSP
jgi:hypothetical protein